MYILITLLNIIFCNVPSIRQEVISFYADKMNKNQLRIEDILKEEDVVNDMKKNSSSQFYSIFSNEIIRSLIDYSTKMPKSNDLDLGYKFPYFSCEILSSDSGIVQELFFHKFEVEIENPDDDDNDSNESEEDDEDEEDEENDVCEKNEKETEDTQKENEQNEENEDKDENKEEIKDKDDLNIEKEDKVEEQPTEESANNKEELQSTVEPKEESQSTDEANEGAQTQTTDEKKEEPQPSEDTKDREPSSENQIGEITEGVNTLSIQEEYLLPEQAEIENKIEDKDINLDYSEDENAKKTKRKRRYKDRKYRIVYDNLDYFFDFLRSPPENSNYVLIGYFNKILSSLIEKKGDTIISYLFENRPDLLDLFVKHLNRRLISDCVSRILTYSNDNFESLNEKKLILVEKIIQELNETRSEDSYEFICCSLITSISNKHFFQLLMSKNELLDLLFSVLFKDTRNERNLQSLLTLMIKINETILKAFNGLVTPERTNEGLLEQMNINYLDGQMNDDERKCILGETEEQNEKNLQLTLKYLFDTLKESGLIFFDNLSKFDKPDLEVTTYESEQKVLGMYKLIQVEYFRTILDILINSYAKRYLVSDLDSLIQTSIDSDIFKNLIDIFFKFEFNNLFQNLFGQIMTIVLNEHCPQLLINHIFNEEKIIEKMQNHLINERIFTFSSERTINSCLFAFEVTFFSDVSNSSNKHIHELIKANAEFQVFNEIYIADMNGIFKGKLCYSDEGNAFSSYQYNSSSNGTQSKTIEYSLDETIKTNMKIYDVYKSGGDYQALLEEKLQKEESLRKRSEDINDNINISNDGNIFDRKREDIEEDNVFCNDDVMLDELNEGNDNDYYDNNYWKKNNPLSDELLNELLS